LRRLWFEVCGFEKAEVIAMEEVDVDGVEKEENRLLFMLEVLTSGKLRSTNMAQFIQTPIWVKQSRCSESMLKSDAGFEIVSVILHG